MGDKAEPDWNTDDREEVERAIVLLNDAVFGFMGIVSAVMVEGSLIGREDLAAAIEHRAGPVDADDHNKLLLAFSRALRMNLPGGKFDVIQGGKAEN